MYGNALNTGNFAHNMGPILQPENKVYSVLWGWQHIFNNQFKLSTSECLPSTEFGSKDFFYSDRLPLVSSTFSLDDVVLLHFPHLD